MKKTMYLTNGFVKFIIYFICLRIGYKVRFEWNIFDDNIKLKTVISILIFLLPLSLEYLSYKKNKKIG